ncbi:hypothetical protein Gpo141_00002919 [Globisporangium polare]
MEIFQDGELEEAMRKSDSLQANSLSTWWRLFCTSYEELIQSITNPMRASYSIMDLGENEFTIDPSKCTQISSLDSSSMEPFVVVRDDLQLANARNEVLECSFWHRKAASTATSTTGDQQAHWRESVSSYRSSIGSVNEGSRASASDPAEELMLLSPPAFAAATSAPCILYLHEMSSSRKECVYLRERILAAGFSLFSLDLSGSGMSEGDRVSFGHFEQDDVRAVLDYLYATGRASRVGIWGHGIGSASALLHLRSAESFHYKSLMLTKKQAQQLQVVEDKETGHLLCMRPSSLRLPFRLTRTDVNNGDFVLLSIGNVPVKGMTAKQCLERIAESQDRRLRIAGYAKSDQDEPDKFVFGLTLDTAFGDMEQVIEDMLLEISMSAQRRDLVLPTAMISAAAKIIGRSVRKTGGFNLRDIQLLDDVPRFQYASLFVCATKKDFITPAHTQALFDKYGGPKQFLQFTGVHDANRPDDVVETVVNHFVALLRARKE